MNNNNNIFPIETAGLETNTVFEALKMDGITFSKWATDAVNALTQAAERPVDGHIGLLTAGNLGVAGLTEKELFCHKGRNILRRVGCRFLQRNDALRFLHIQGNRQEPIVWFVHPLIKVSSYSFFFNFERRKNGEKHVTVRIPTYDIVDSDYLLAVRIRSVLHSTI